MSKNSVSVIVPTYNEVGNIKTLLSRIANSFDKKKKEYEIVVIDDHSTDGTWELLNKLTNKYPLIIKRKEGEKGKAFSLLEGFNLANYEIVAMIDADLQYPPEAIPQMVEKLDENTDIVVSDRVYKSVGTSRKILHWGFKNFFGKILHGLNLDVQSGLKVFKKEILDKIELKPKQWTFDLEFLLKAKNAGYTPVSHKIDFVERTSGESKIKHLEAIWEIGFSALHAKFTPWRHIPHQKMQNKTGRVGTRNSRDLMNGFYYKGKEYVHHTGLHPKESALFSLTTTQQVLLIGMVIIFLVSLLINWYITFILVISFISLLYFMDLLHNFYLIVKSSLNNPQINFSDEEIDSQKTRDWPMYTIFCPLYKEARVLPQFIKAIKNFDYPKDKLQVMLLLEDDDEETIEAAENMNLADFIEVFVVPPSEPKTKPKACNYGLQFAKGEYSVIYDAEDIPDPKQLKKAVMAFENLGSSIQCVQAKLNFYNPQQNLLTRLFTGEYTLWFEMILTGLQAANAPIPLGGTSNHFRTKYLQKLNGWDAFNVTEDCDLGIRLVRRGHRTAIINSTTMEEANSNLKNWFNQRTRWVKGYIQTYFVHMRDPEKFISKNGLMDFLYFQLVVGGKVLSMLVNPIMWILFISYFVFGVFVGDFIESLFITPVFYISAFSLVVGNFIYFYHYMIAVATTGKYELVKYSYFVPIYWFLMSMAAWTAVYRLVKEPHYWSKTEHGLHLNPQASFEYVQDINPATV